jgi:hypothetical protein
LNSFVGIQVRKRLLRKETRIEIRKAGCPNSPRLHLNNGFNQQTPAKFEVGQTQKSAPSVVCDCHLLETNEQTNDTSK